MFKLPCEHAVYLRDREEHFMLVRAFGSMNCDWKKLIEKGITVPRRSQKSFVDRLFNAERNKLINKGLL